MVAGQLRRLDSIKLARLLPLELRPKLRLVHATSAAESSRPTVVRLPATRTRSRRACNSQAADGLGCHWQWDAPRPLPSPPTPFICKNMGKHPVISELPPSPCQYMYVYCMYMHIYTIICMYTAVYICICMYMYVYVCIIAKWTVKCLSTKNSICKYIRVYVCICM